jgi:siderophore synthetase component
MTNINEVLEQTKNLHKQVKMICDDLEVERFRFDCMFRNEIVRLDQLLREQMGAEE